MACLADLVREVLADDHAVVLDEIFRVVQRVEAVPLALLRGALVAGGAVRLAVRDRLRREQRLFQK